MKVDKSTADMAQMMGINFAQILVWKKQCLESASSLFDGEHVAKTDIGDIDNFDEFCKKIGKLRMERIPLVSRPGARGYLS